MQTAEPWLEKGIHPLVIIGGYAKDLEDTQTALEKYSVPLDLKDRALMLKVWSNFLFNKNRLSMPPLEQNLLLDGETFLPT